MKTLYMILIVVAALALVAGVVIKLFADVSGLPAWLAPPTLWRGGVGAAALAGVLIVLDIRNLIAKKQGA